ncbi:MAG: DUF4412 domain-containing protein [Myxococcales bacterium]
MKRLLILVLAALAPSTALADWQADLTMTPIGEGAQDGAMLMQGKVRSRKDRARMELKTPVGPRVSITDHKEKKTWMLNADAKSYVEIDHAKLAAQGGEQMPSCSGDIDACLPAQGFKKVGAGEANGHKCTIWEKTSGSGGQVHTQRLWRPNALKEVVMVRMTSSGGPRGMEMNLTNLEMTPQDPSLFEIPEGYSKQSTPMMPVGTGGKPPSREQLEQLMKQYGNMKPPQGQ